MATLYMVGVPIGNLEDMTARAQRILGEVDFIVCEDTRHSQRLLNHYGIHKKLYAVHGHNEERAAQGIIALMDQGQNGAYISDAGTPGISDPGGKLADAAVAASHTVCPIPGPSALAAILSVAGLPGKSMLFEGFLSPKSGRRKKQLISLLERSDIGIVYESPFRISALLNDLEEIAPDAQVVLGRELTKIHEEVLKGSAAGLAEIFRLRQSIKGEFVIAIAPRGSGKRETEET